MTIKENIYGGIVRTPKELPPESGGLLGGRNGIVTQAFFDKGIENECLCSYTPNVNIINAVIAEWGEKAIDFMGMFHTHFFGVETLSNGDERYIRQIMDSVSEYVSELYFPIVVLPERRLTVYKATWHEKMTEIVRDCCQIIP